MDELASDPGNGGYQGVVTPPRPGLTSRLNAIAEVLLCSSVPTQIAIGGLLHAAGLDARDADGDLALPFILVLSVVDTVVLIALMVFLTRVRGERVRDLWLGSRPVRGEIFHGLLLIPVIFVAVIVLLNTMRVFAPWLHNVPVNPLEQLAGTPGQAAIFAIVAIVAGGIREELQRAFLLQRFERYLGGALIGVIVLNVAFGLGHFVQGWDAVITTGTLGAFWAVLYLRRRSSIAPVVSHAGFNSLEVLRVAIWGMAGAQ